MRTMVLFDMLGKYKWDAKMALVLAALVTIYGKFRLLMQLNPQDPLAASIAMLKQLPYDLSALKPRLKALGQLVKTMVDVTKCIIKFENLSLSYEGLDKEISVAKSYIYVASYWVIRSAFTCSSQITDLTPMKPEQVHVLSLQLAYIYIYMLTLLLLPHYLCRIIDDFVMLELDPCAGIQIQQ